ncbi:MAG: ABC transporter permease [FCB group bacterium]|nr:ABC transporter permease [FCB group bacterium]
MAGKGLACFITCMGVSALLLIIGNLGFNVRLENFAQLGMAMAASAICFVGIMMLISVMGKTEQAVSGAGWAILLVMSMIGGGMIPLMFMPSWLLIISHFSPVKWGIYALEGAIWRGFTVSEMLLPTGILFGVGISLFLIGSLILSRTDR